MNKKIFLSLIFFYAIMGSFNSIAQSCIYSCIQDYRTGNLSHLVHNSGCDANDLGGAGIRVFVNDGTNPQVVVSDNISMLNYRQALGSNNVWDPDVAISYDQYSGNYFINVVYLDLNTWQYKLEQTQYTPMIGFSTTTVTTTLFSITSSLSPRGSGIPSSLWNGAPNATINIDINELGELGAIVFENPSTNYTYGCVFDVWGGLSSACLISKNAIEPDVAVYSDLIYFSYVDVSFGNIRKNIKVQEELHGNVAACNISNNKINAISSAKNLSLPRIATNSQYTSHSNDWTIVSEERANGNYDIIGATGLGLNVIATNNYTNSSTWASPTSPTYSTSYWGQINIQPSVSYNLISGNSMGALQIAWSTNDYLNSLIGSSAGVGTVVGVLCDNQGRPALTSNTCGNTGVFYEILPYMLNSVPPPLSTGSGSPIVLSHVLNNTGNINQRQTTVSLSGKNATSFMGVYYDGLSAEMLYKDSYNASSGFRQAKPKTESVINTAASKLALSISPNPFTENIKITSTNNDAVCNLIIRDISGRELVNATGNTEKLNTAITTANTTLNAGIYFINIKNETGILLNQKIVKQ